MNIIIALHCSLQLKFEEDLAITEMYSGEGEMVPFCNVLYPKGNVEDWLLEVEKLMRLSLKEIIRDSLGDYHKVMKEDNVFYTCCGIFMCKCTCIYACTCSVSEIHSNKF